jgi:RecA/RadA recombinase
VPTAWIPSLALAAHLIPARQLEAREKRRRLATGIAALDELLGGGWTRGALNELCGGRSSGRTAVLLASLAAALHEGESAALIDVDGALDPRAAARMGVPLARLLWVRAGEGAQRAAGLERIAGKALTAAGMVLGAGGFALVAVDMGGRTPRVPGAAWLRLKRSAAGQQAALLVAAPHRLPGALGATALALRPVRPRLDRHHAEPLLLGLEVSARLERGAREPAPDLPLALVHRPSR